MRLPGLQVAEKSCEKTPFFQRKTSVNNGLLNSWQFTINKMSSSPQKRLGSESSVSLNDSKRPKTESSQSIDDFSINGLALPTVSSPLIDSPSQIPISSNISTPLNSQIQLEFPSLSQTNNLQLPQQTTTITNINNKNDNNDIELTKSKTPADPEKLSDALLSAGVDLKAEEALLTSTVNNLPAKPGVSPDDDSIRKPIVINTPFLDPRQLSVFMNKVLRNNGLKQAVDADPAILELVTNSCEEWLTDILTSTVIMSRHRRRSIKNRKRSDISKALRDLSVKQRTLEDQRIEKKKNFGITNDDTKEASEETQHKATNATVAMMTGSKKKKKYSWMTGGAGANNARNTSTGGAGADGGIRFREAREEPGVSLRDLLGTLEKKRMGVDKTIVKGYAKLKD